MKKAEKRKLLNGRSESRWAVYQDLYRKLKHKFVTFEQQKKKCATDGSMIKPPVQVRPDHWLCGRKDSLCEDRTCIKERKSAYETFVADIQREREALRAKASAAKLRCRTEPLTD